MKKHIIFILCILPLLAISCFKGTSDEEPLIEYDNPAIYKVSEQIKYNPDDAELYLTRASLFNESGLNEEAIADMQKAMSFDSASIVYRHILSDFYFDSDKDNEALSLLEETTNLFPANEHTLLKLAEFQYILEMHTPALQTINKLIAVNPENMESFYMKGKIYNQKGDKAAAIKNYKKVLAVNDKHFDCLLELGTIYSLDKKKEALKYLDKALELSPSNPDIVFELGDYYRFQGQDDEALKHYKQVVLLDQQYTDAHLNSGIIYMDQKSYDKAFDLFNIAVETDPSYPSAYYYRGAAAAYLNDINNARRDFEQALDLAPSYEEAKEALEGLK
ncbi:MAG: tetratricopeptide (TPR) repeat protein [Maribacter sp.]|jgi:tetratricopeptide (TPR) repeat protein